MKQRTIEPCLCRFNPSKDEECFLLQYVDDSLIAGTKEAIRQLQHKLNKHFKYKFQKPKDFLGMDIEHKELGQITLSHDVRILVLFYTVNFTTYSSMVDYTILTLVPR
jgi:hypothetical protein